MKTFVFTILTLIFSANLASAQVTTCDYPVTIQVAQSDASGNTTLPGTSGCALRVVKAVNPETGVVEVQRCLAGNGEKNVNDPLIAVQVNQVVSAFGIHNPNGGIERSYCASQLRGK